MLASPPDLLDAQTDEVLVLAFALRQLVKPGLPVVPELADDVLLDLPGVRARATQPDDRLSRVAALDGLLRWTLARFDDESMAEAARALFGLAPATTGSTLTERRLVAAAASGHEVHHFRKRIEPKILSLLGWSLRKDSNDYAQTRAVAPPLAPVTGRLRIPTDPFAWEAAEHAELLSRLWGAVYVLRADLLAVARTRSMRGDPDELADLAGTALWRYAQVLALAATYRAAFGDVLLHADSGLPPEGLAALAGWMPPLGGGTRDVLAAAAGADRGRFLEALAGDAVTGEWCLALTGAAPPTGSNPTRSSA